MSRFTHDTTSSAGASAEQRGLQERERQFGLREALSIYRECGGTFHGPIVEHASCEEQAFHQFIERMIDAARRSPLAKLDGPFDISAIEARARAAIDENDAVSRKRQILVELDAFDVVALCSGTRRLEDALRRIADCCGNAGQGAIALQALGEDR